MKATDYLNKQVTVIDNSNYIGGHAEEAPFKGTLILISENRNCWVKSNKTGKEYELYPHQIKELQNMED